jgi:hypothetical protein
LAAPESPLVDITHEECDEVMRGREREREERAVLEANELGDVGMMVFAERLCSGACAQTPSLLDVFPSQ